jgi:glycerophosphoryl diester phosphodiesterase
MTLIIAHRGATAEFSENTIPAFESAIALGADMVEFDVRSTLDQVLVVHHDAEIQGQLIRHLTWAEIQTINCEMPQLKDVIACCQHRIGMDIELKEPDLEQQVWQHVRHLSQEAFCITSFSLDVLETCRQISTALQLGFLVDQAKGDRLIAEQAQSIRNQLQAIGINFIAPHWQTLKTDWLTALAPEDLAFYVWTVNPADSIAELLNHNRVAGIITDRLDLALKLRSQG